MTRSHACIALTGRLSGVLAPCQYGNAQETYDYFGNIRYPGERRPDVGLDKIEQEGAEDAVGVCNRRVVNWWPKKGMDIVDPPEGVELRTWTRATATTVT